MSGLEFRARICVARALMSVAEFFADLALTTAGQHRSH